jgi:hypothetical protein
MIQAVLVPFCSTDVACPFFYPVQLKPRNMKLVRDAENETV